jgi:predicted Zn-ribbon and HTH transcriptional regulator
MKWDTEKARKQKEYRERDPEKWTTYNREYQRRYREANKAKLAERKRRYYWANLEKMRSLYRKERDKVLHLLGARCNRCGFSDVRALQVDHINGGGKKDRRRFSCVWNYYKNILRKKGEGYQVLCANCNQIKKAENQEW